MAKGTKVLPEPTKTAASSASGAVRKDAPPLHTKQAFELTWFIAAWSVFSVITFLAVLDRFTTNVSPRQHFAIEHGWAACEKLKPYGNGTETKMGSACGTDYFCGSEEQFELNKGEMPAAVRPPSRLAFLFCAFLKCSTHLGKRVRDIPTRLLVLLIGRVCVAGLREGLGRGEWGRAGRQGARINNISIHVSPSTVLSANSTFPF